MSGHRLPRFSTINWALCVPSTCSREDVEIGLKEYVGNFTQGTGLQFRMQVSKEMCQTKEHNWFYKLDDNTKVAIVFFMSILIIAIASSLYEYKKGENEKNPWFTAFSLVKNSKSLFSLDRDQNDIRSVHGIRFFNAVMLIISHKTMAMFYNPYMNRTSMSEKLGQPWTVIGRAASLYTDPFIMLSGLLTAYSLIGRLQKGHTIKVMQEYITRLFRIIPPLAALIFFCTFILPLMGSGPQWNLVVTNNADLCKQYWWRNLMFIHNYFGFEKMCLTHTHHVGIDTQLFLLAPLLVSILWKWPQKGGIFLGFLALLSTIARFYVTMTKSLSNYVFFGTSVSQLFDTADFMYTLPAHRITVYIMGILLGYVLRTCKDMKLTKNQLKIGWWVNTALIFSSFFGPAPMGSINYIYKPSHAAHYAAFAPIAWCSFFAWIIFSSHLGYNNSLTRLLQWKGFLVSTRISYAVYLTQFPIFFFNVGKVRNPIHFGFIKLVINTNEYIFVVLISIALTLFFEYPFTNIKKILFNNKPEFVKSSAKSISSNNKISYQLEKSVRYDATGIRSLLD